MQAERRRHRLHASAMVHSRRLSARRASRAACPLQFCARALALLPDPWSDCPVRERGAHPSSVAFSPGHSGSDGSGRLCISRPGRVRPIQGFALAADRFKKPGGNLSSLPEGKALRKHEYQPNLPHFDLPPLLCAESLARCRLSSPGSVLGTCTASLAAPDLVGRSRTKLDLLDAEDPAPVRLVPENLGEQPFRLPAGWKEPDDAVDLIAYDGPQNHARRLDFAAPLAFRPSERVSLTKRRPSGLLRCLICREFPR
jgi:hypothetical protein